MDTLAFRKPQISIPAKAVEYGIIALIIMTFIMTSNITQPAVNAKDLIANNMTGVPTLSKASYKISRQISEQYLKEIFEEEVNSKYNGYTITNIAEGIKHVKITKYFNGRPVRLNVIEMNNNIAKDFEIRPATASENTLQHKTTLRTIAWKTNSIVAVNGGFFKPQTGVPLGTLMIDKKLYTGPIYNRVALGIFDDGYRVDRLQFQGAISANGYTIKIDNINQPRILSSYVLAYSRDWGSYAPASPRYGVQLQIVGDKIVKASANPLPIPENGYVIVGPKDKLSLLYGAEKVNIQMETSPKWEGVKHIISGGPYLVKDNQIFVDTADEKLNAISGKNPRTAIGYTASNNFIIVTADGREGSSVGLTLYELAQFMKSIGCVNAINLDGGGSTVMYVDGKIVNQPPQVGGIALSNALVIAKKSYTEQ